MQFQFLHMQKHELKFRSKYFKSITQFYVDHRRTADMQGKFHRKNQIIRIEEAVRGGASKLSLPCGRMLTTMNKISSQEMESMQ